MSALDPLTFAVVAGGLESVVREMTITMVKTSRSPILSEGYDFSNSIFDGASRMVMQGHNIPVHVGAMIDAGKAVAAYFGDEIAPGDVVYCNDPAFEGSHLPDMTMYKPVFFEGELIFWTANKSHMMDTGGPVAGGYNPFAKDIYAEGLRISPVKLYDRGKPRRDVIDLLLTNVRLPRALRGDLRAQLAAVTRAEGRLVGLLERHGRETVLRCCDELLDRAERLMREHIGRIPDGTYEGSGMIEDYGHGQGDTVIRASLTVSGTELRVALAAPPQADSYFNSYGNNTKSMVYYAMLATITGDVPHNEGLYRSVTIDLGPPGSRVNPVLPAACAQSTGSVADAVWDAVSEAISKALPERATAGWARPYVVIFAGVNPRTGERWADYSLAGGAGGGGASWGVDGWNVVGWVNAGGACHHGDTESLEYKEPIRMIRHELRRDSAEPGRWRGGCGAVHEVELLADVAMTSISEGVLYPAPSRVGAGAVDASAKVHAKWTVAPDGTRAPVVLQNVAPVTAGTRILSYSAGGGGVGDPWQRDPELVRADVRDGLVSIAAAHLEYGVVVDPRTFELDAGATEAHRETARRRGQASV